MRKYVVFWAIIILSLALVAAAVFLPRQQQAEIEAQTTAEERLAIELEDRYSEVDVVNVRNFVDENNNRILGLYFEVLTPVNADNLEGMILDMLQELHRMRTGAEDQYALFYLYGNWLVGRTTCPAAQLPDVQAGVDLCNYENVDPPEYAGRLVRFSGRSGD